MKKDVSVIILTAGKSSRMGQPKMLLKLKNGLSFIENLLIQYTHFGCEDLIVVVNKENLQLLKKSMLSEKYSFTMVLNHHPEKERFYSIQCGLRDIKDSEFVFIHNVDNPFADQELLAQLYEKRNEADYVKPVFKNRGGHPILISRHVFENAKQSDSLQLTFKFFLKNFECKKVESDNENIFTNINSESDYLRLLHGNESV